MEVFVYVIIYLGSAVMLFNCFGFFLFAYRMSTQYASKKGNVVYFVPFILVVLFLFGYLGVAIWGKPDLLVGMILFGGAIFVLVMLLLLRRITDRIKENEELKIQLLASEESHRAKSAFFANMSHEIRTPMNAIIGLDNIALRDPDLSPRTRERFEKIGASAKHLLGIINDILDMSRIESGRMALKNEEFLFHDLIEQVNIIINGQCLDKGLHYECVVSGEFADYYYGDDMKLKQILINILGNAVKFTVSGGVSLTVKEVERQGGSATLSFVISDTGIDMDPDFIPKIFEAFSQEDASSTNRYGGSGLGMAITKSFVEMMGGHIEIKSQKGVGSTFFVTLRLKTSERSYQSENGVRLREGLCALVVDDDPIACEHAELVLHSLGVSSSSALTPAEGLAKAKAAIGEERPFDLVLTDYRMPDMDGLGFSRAYREFAGDKSILFLVTDYNSELLDGEAESCGVDSVIAKPLFTDSLLHATLTVAERKGGFTEAIQTEEKEEETVSLEGLRILIAEDVDANAEILANLLELEGIETERAENGQVAVDLYFSHDAHYYDAILMDVRMPVKDGLAATKEIRQMDKEDAQSIPIYALTANVFDEDVKRSLDAGMNAHLSKPIEPETIYDTLRRIAKSRKS